MAQFVIHRPSRTRLDDEFRRPSGAHGGRQPRRERVFEISGVQPLRSRDSWCRRPVPIFPQTQIRAPLI